MSRQLEELLDWRKQRDSEILEALNAGYFFGVCAVCGTDLVGGWAECTRFQDKNAKFIPTTTRCPNRECEAEK